MTSDKVVYERPDQPSWQFKLAATSDDQRVIISIGDGEVGDSRKYQLAVLQVANNEVKVIEDHFASEYEFLGSRAAKLYFVTDEHAPHKRIAAFDLARTRGSPWSPRPALRSVMPRSPASRSSRARCTTRTRSSSSTT